MMSFFIFIFLIALLAISTITLIALMLGVLGAFIAPVPFVPVPPQVTDALPKLLQLTDKSVLYDLGCGDGRVLMRTAIPHPRTKMIGADKAPLPYLLAQWYLYWYPHKNVSVRYQDLFSVPLHDATHVFIYLFPHLVQRLLPKFAAELKPGTRVVSCDFPFDAKEPTEKVVVGSGYGRHTLYVYEF